MFGLSGRSAGLPSGLGVYVGGWAAATGWASDPGVCFRQAVYPCLRAVPRSSRCEGYRRGLPQAGTEGIAPGLTGGGYNH